MWAFADRGALGLPGGSAAQDTGNGSQCPAKNAPLRVSVGALGAKLCPPEHPAEDFQVLAAGLADAVAFAGESFVVVAVQAQGAIAAFAQAVDAQLAVVQHGVDLAFNHAGQAAVDGQRGAVGDQRHHVVVGHAQAQGMRRVDAEAVERQARQAQVTAFDRLGLAGANPVKRQLFVVVAVGGEREVVGVCGFRRHARAGGARQRAAMLGAFSGPQPFAAHAQQLGDLVEPGLGHATMKPVVHMLRGHPALGGEVRSGQVALAQQSLESITGCIHGD